MRAAAFSHPAARPCASQRRCCSSRRPGAPAPTRRPCPAWSPAQQPSRTPSPASAAAAEPAAEEPAAPLPPPPAARHQPALSGKERAALRARSEALARDKALQRLQVGAAGITFNVLAAAADTLAKHEFLRVRLGEGCGCERKEAAALLGELLDAAVVGQVGFTITLYRQKGLPRPDNLPKPGT